MKLDITHTTSYAYDEPVNYALQQVRLTPTSNAQQQVKNWSVDIEGGITELSYDDQYGNHTTLVQAEPGITEVRFVAHGTVETSDTSGVTGKAKGSAPLWLFTQHTERTKPGKKVRKLAKILGKTDNMLNDLHDLSKEIIKAVPYQTASTFAETTAEEALAAKAGVCQDHAQIFVAAARHVGLPARYVSGYLMMNDRIDQDASHAWAETYIEELGWVGFDVSNRISPDERYVKLAIGLDSRSAAPISGLRIGQGNETMIVSLQVQQ